MRRTGGVHPVWPHCSGKWCVLCLGSVLEVLAGDRVRRSGRDQRVLEVRLRNDGGARVGGEEISICFGPRTTTWNASSLVDGQLG